MNVLKRATHQPSSQDPHFFLLIHSPLQGQMISKMGLVRAITFRLG
jgi:hypothetical protein